MSSLDWHRFVHPLPELGADCFELRRQFLSNRSAQHRELPASGFTADMGKAQKIESPRLALIPVAPILGRETAELDQPRLFRV